MNDRNANESTEGDQARWIPVCEELVWDHYEMDIPGQIDHEDIVLTPFPKLNYEILVRFRDNRAYLLVYEHSQPENHTNNSVETDNDDSSEFAKSVDIIVSDAFITVDPAHGGLAPGIKICDESKEKVETFTAEHLNVPIAITYNECVISLIRFEQAASDELYLPGIFRDDFVREVVNDLRQ